MLFSAGDAVMLTGVGSVKVVSVGKADGCSADSLHCAEWDVVSETAIDRYLDVSETTWYLIVYSSV